TAGDVHRRGRRVAVLRFADGSRVVYKPRPLAADRHFGELVGWYSTRAGTPVLRTPALLTRPDHGWSELIEARPCASPAELDRFYRRLGALLALAHVLDLTDLHHENLIACAGHPVLVDLDEGGGGSRAGVGGGPGVRSGLGVVGGRCGGGSCSGSRTQKGSPPWCC
ncbi:DUF4135 domain-containing protein, partial [Streptomyces sp. NPDC007070]|uniref:DUF4135 domain-containing protein n=1 Tax=Streptomyces sp. NPDC007070 TaxID=3154312 RepID=UPI003403618D